MKRLILFFVVSGFLYGQVWMQTTSRLNLPKEVISEITDRCSRELNIADKKFIGHELSLPRINIYTIDRLVKEYLITVKLNFENELKKIQWVKFHVKIFESALKKEYRIVHNPFIPNEFLSAFQIKEK